MCSDISVAVGSVSGASASLGSARPQVVNLDLDLSCTSGLDFIGALQQRAAVLVLTAYGSTDDLETALRAGARGYLLKGVSLDELERAIATVADGNSYIDPRASAGLIHGGAALTTRKRGEKTLSPARS